MRSLSDGDGDGDEDGGHRVHIWEVDDVQNAAISGEVQWCSLMVKKSRRYSEVMR